MDNEPSRVLEPRRFKLLAALIILACCALEVWPIISAPNDLLPAGVDTMGHLTKSFSLARRWKSLQFGDWFPEWYNGATAVQYYPPLSIWVLTVIQVVVNNIFVTYKIFSFSCFFLGGYLAFWLASRTGIRFGGALVAGVLYTTGFTIHTMWVQVTPGTTLAFPLYPVLVAFLIDYCDSPSSRNWVKSWLVATAILLSHVMHAYLLFFTTSIFMLVWSLLRKKPMRVIGMIEIAVVAVVTTGFWSIPGVTQLENTGVPWSPPEMSTIRTMSAKLLFGRDAPYPSRVLLGAAALGLLVWFIRSRRRGPAGWALLISLSLTLSVTIGPTNPLYSLLPMSKSLAPVRFMNAAYLPASMAAGLFADGLAEIVHLGRGKRARRVVPGLVSGSLIMASLLIDMRPTLPKPSTFPEISRLISAIPITGQGMFGSGRVAEEMPIVEGEAAFLPVQRGLATTVGWNIEGTIHIYTLHNQNIAYFEGYPEYVLRNWYLWNARSAVIDRRYSLMMERAQNDGWSLKSQQGAYALLTLDREPTYVMRPNISALAIGRSSFYVSGLFPWVSEGRDTNPLNYSEEYIGLFSCIILYDLPPLDAAALEGLIIRWVRAGKTVIVDLSVTDSLSELLGVGHSEIEVSGVLPLMTTDAGSRIYGTDTNVHLKDGRGAVYTNLDGVFLEAVTEQGSQAICGFRDLQYGQVYFIGGHIPRLAESSYREEARAVWAPLLHMSGPDTTLIPEALPVSNPDWTVKGVKFTCDLDEETPALISVTYTPRWEATVDGVRIPVHKHENLVLLVLPSGVHRVELRYLTTHACKIGWGISLLALLWVGFRALMPMHFQQRLLQHQLKKVSKLWNS